MFDICCIESPVQLVLRGVGDCGGMTKINILLQGWIEKIKREKLNPTVGVYLDKREVTTFAINPIYTQISRFRALIYVLRR